DITAVSGTTPTLLVTIDTSHDGTTWTQKASFTQATAIGSQTLTPVDLTELYFRVNWVITGSSASFTFKGSAPDGQGGILDPYPGLEPNAPPAAPLDPQLTQLLSLIGTRQVDALLLSVGANDVKFSTVIKNCIAVTNCDSVANNGEFYDLIAKLPDKYDALAAALVAAGIPANRTYITQYYDPTQAGRGNFVPLLGALSFIGLGVDASELQWASTTVVGGMNTAVAEAASRNGWHLVDGINDQFIDHGYMADDHYVVQILESVSNQSDIQGSFHPNGKGQAVYATQITKSVEAGLSISGSAPSWQGFQSVAAQTISTSGTTLVATGDIDNDGLADLVIAGPSSVKAYLNKGVDATGAWQQFNTTIPISI